MGWGPGLEEPDDNLGCGCGSFRFDVILSGILARDK